MNIMQTLASMYQATVLKPWSLPNGSAEDILRQAAKVRSWRRRLKLPLLTPPQRALMARLGEVPVQQVIDLLIALFIVCPELLTAVELPQGFLQALKKKDTILMTIIGLCDKLGARAEDGALQCGQAIADGNAQAQQAAQEALSSSEAGADERKQLRLTLDSMQAAQQEKAKKQEKAQKKNDRKLKQLDQQLESSQLVAKRRAAEQKLLDARKKGNE